MHGTERQGDEQGGSLPGQRRGGKRRERGGFGEGTAGRAKWMTRWARAVRVMSVVEAGRQRLIEMETEP